MTVKMDEKPKTTSLWGCRVTKMPFLEEKIKFKKPPLKRRRFVGNGKKILLPPMFFFSSLKASKLQYKYDEIHSFPSIKLCAKYA
jgi:hypothetical protein